MVLRTVAERLGRAVARFKAQYPDLLVARFGGDEFVIVLRYAAAADRGIALAEACKDAFNDPIAYEALEFYSAPSIGMAVYPQDGDDVATVFKHADAAMYQAKSGTSTAVAVYTPAMSARLRDWLELESRLRRAVHNDLLNLVFQPKFRLSDNRVVGVEALLRWHDGEFGDVAPNRFVEIAEDSGLILDMSSWVVRAACRQLRNWMDLGHAVPIAINCSGKELLHGDPARVFEVEASGSGGTHLVDRSGDHRVTSRERLGDRAAGAAANTQAGMPYRARRFRYRLLVARLHHSLPARSHQDRQSVRAGCRSRTR